MQAITTKYYGPGNVRGARIKAQTESGIKVWVSYDHGSDNPHRDAAVALCRKLGWHGTLCEGGTREGSVFVFVTDRDCVTV